MSDVVDPTPESTEPAEPVTPGEAAPPPHTATPPAEPGAPEGDVKPAETDGDAVDAQSSPANQELQETGDAPAREGRDVDGAARPKGDKSSDQ